VQSLSKIRTMKLFITILFSILFNFSVKAQSISFEKYLDDSITYEITAVCTVGSNYLLLCNQSIANFDQHDPFIYMLDSMGNILFKKEYDFNFQSNFLHVEKMKDNKLLFVGNIDSFNTDFSTKMDGLVMITDSVGNMLSLHVFSFNTNTYLYHGTIEDSTFVLIGRRHELNSIRNDILVLKSDYNFNLIDSTIIHKQKNDYGIRINKSFNDKYLICGQLFDNIGTTSFYSLLNSNLDSIYLRRYWHMVDQDSGEIALWGVLNAKETFDKHIILSNVFKTLNPLIPNPPFGMNYQRIGLMKFDSLGTLLKTVVYYNLNSRQDRPIDIFEDTDGGFRIPGTYEFNSDFTTTIKPNGDFYLIKVDSSLNRIWDKKYGNADYQEMKAAIPTKDGGMIMVGSTYNNTRKIKNGYVVKTDASGNVNTGVEQKKIQELNIYPNPVSNTLYINTNATITTYRITDILGNVISEGEVNGNSISIEELYPGLYVIKAIDNKGAIYRNKFVKN